MIRKCVEFKKNGFTIIELVATIVILAIAMVGVAAMVGRGLTSSADTLLETRAIALGYAYLDEIIGRRFDEKSHPSGLIPCFGLPADPGPPPRPCTAVAGLGTDSGEVLRRRYDDVDDYHGMVQGDGEATPLQDAEGNDRDGYENFHVEIGVRYAGMDMVFAGTRALTDAKLITVTVRYRTQTDGFDFSAYKANY